MDLRIDLICFKCNRGRICTCNIPEKTEKLHVICGDCDNEIIVLLSLVRIHGREFVGNGDGLSIRIDKL